MSKFYQMPVILELVTHMVSTTDKYSLSRYSAFSCAQMLVSSKQFDCSRHQPHIVIVSHIAQLRVQVQIPTGCFGRGSKKLPVTVSKTCGTQGIPFA